MSSRRRQLVLAPEARHDLSDVLLWTEQHWGTHQRGVYRRALDAAMRKLTRFPYLGPVRGDVSGELRGHSVREHVIYYRVSEQEITVVRILHGKMDAARHLGQP